MASSDVVAFVLQMMKQMQEQQHVAQEMMQEQQWATDERQRQFMAAILNRRADLTPEGFNGCGGQGYDDFVPGEVAKTAPSGDETT